MNVALVGFSASGRSTLYRAAARGLGKGDVTAVPVPDERFTTIVQQAKPKKATPASVVLHDDLPHVEPTGKMFSARFLEDARGSELLLHVVRAFDSPAAPYHDTVDPLRDLDRVSTEMVLADLQIVENRLERLLKMQTSRQPGTHDYAQRLALEYIREPLERGTPVRALHLEDEHLKALNGLQMLTAKQMVVAFNVGEDGAASPGPAIEGAIAELAQHETPAFSVCAALEEELAQLPEEDQPEFLASMGLAESAGDKLVRAVYEGLGLITFFTVGPQEARAWPLRKGSTALKAAETVHTDIARGFIRAEVVHYPDYLAAGSVDAANKANKMRLEGKEYVVRDGDILHIRNKS